MTREERKQMEIEKQARARKQPFRLVFNRTLSIYTSPLNVSKAARPRRDGENICVHYNEAGYIIEKTCKCVMNK